MNMNNYQKKALVTYKRSDTNMKNRMRMVLGVTGEAGEIAEKYKKAMRDNVCMDSDEFKSEVAKEIGDVMWYLAVLSDDIGYSMGSVGKMNLKKLKDRAKRNKISGSGDDR